MFFMSYLGDTVCPRKGTYFLDIYSTLNCQLIPAIINTYSHWVGAHVHVVQEFKHYDQYKSFHFIQTRKIEQ